VDAVGKAPGRRTRSPPPDRGPPGILNHTEKPEYGTCVDIVTKAALREMIFPAPAANPRGAARGRDPMLGAKALGGVLVGTIITGLFVAISLTSSGGAWDNARSSSKRAITAARARLPMRQQSPATRSAILTRNTSGPRSSHDQSRQHRGDPDYSVVLLRENRNNQITKF